MQFTIITLIMAGENSTFKEFSQLPCGSHRDFYSNEQKSKRLRCCIIAMDYSSISNHLKPCSQRASNRSTTHLNVDATVDADTDAWCE